MIKIKKAVIAESEEAAKGCKIKFSSYVMRVFSASSAVKRV